MHATAPTPRPTAPFSRGRSRIRIARIALFAVGAAGLLLAACSALIHADDVQCTTDGDCTARGEAFAGTTCTPAGVCALATTPPPADASGDGGRDSAVDAGYEGGPWDCIGSGATRPAPPKSTITIRMRFVDGSTVSNAQDPYVALRRATGVDGARIRLCSSLDVDCTLPIVTGDAGALVTDADGWADVPIASDFDGYFDIQRNDYYRMRLFLGAPVPEIEHEFLNAMLRLDTPPSLAAVLGVTLNNDAGIISVGAHDCTSAFAAGVHYEVAQRESDTTGFYIIDGFPTTTAQASGPTGSGGFINAIPGAYEIHGELLDSGLRVGTKRIVVRGGAHTHITFIAR